MAPSLSGAAAASAAAIACPSRSGDATESVVPIISFSLAKKKMATTDKKKRTAIHWLSIVGKLLLAVCLAVIGGVGIAIYRNAPADVKSETSVEMVYAVVCGFFGVAVGIIFEVITMNDWFSDTFIVKRLHLIRFLLIGFLMATAFFAIDRLRTVGKMEDRTRAVSTYLEAQQYLAGVGAFGVGVFVSFVFSCVEEFFLEKIFVSRVTERSHHIAAYIIIVLSGLGSLVIATASSINMVLLVETDQRCSFGPLIDAQNGCTSSIYTNISIAMLIISGLGILAAILYAVLCGVPYTRLIFWGPPGL